MTNNIRVNFKPIGRSVTTQSNTTLLSVAQRAGVGLMAVCNGSGTCHECIVRIIEGRTNPPTEVELQTFSDQKLALGFRLACQVILQSAGCIEIPSESISAFQRLQLEGYQSDFPIDPAVTGIVVKIETPLKNDQGSEIIHLMDNLKVIRDDIKIPEPVADRMTLVFRKCKGQVRIAMHENGTITGVAKIDQRLYGLAIDIGTTKLAAYLVDLESGQTVDKLGAVNPQISYGEDVISRIAYAGRGDYEKEQLHTVLSVALDSLVDGLCKTAGITDEQIVDAVVVGNTAMHHFFANLPTQQLGVAPYGAAVNESLLIPSGSLGLYLSPGALTYLPPVIAGFVGADHIAAELASGIIDEVDNTLLVDVGTNTEISLKTRHGLLCCSCASGPAFEGTHLSAGMRAAAGAIERVFFDGSEWYYLTIDGQPPVGICGSGILDAIAEMHHAGIINESGSLQGGDKRVITAGNGKAFQLVPTDPEKGMNAINITRKDVNEIQLAKAAIRSGIEILLKEAGIKPDDIHKFIVAGAFGSYLHLPSAIAIGMFPDIPLGRFSQVGNAAGAGARMMLFSKDARRSAEAIPGAIRHIDLSVRKDFQDIFMAALPISNRLKFE